MLIKYNVDCVLTLSIVYFYHPVILIMLMYQFREFSYLIEMDNTVIIITSVLKFVLLFEYEYIEDIPLPPIFKN